MSVDKVLCINIFATELNQLSLLIGIFRFFPLFCFILFLFFIKRGCRGDLILPYLLLLSIEILGIIIRENRKGVTVNYCAICK